jgi:hypothetical protein
MVETGDSAMARGRKSSGNHQSKPHRLEIGWGMPQKLREKESWR